MIDEDCSVDYDFKENLALGSPPDSKHGQGQAQESLLFMNSSSSKKNENSQSLRFQLYSVRNDIKNNQPRQKNSKKNSFDPGRNNMITPPLQKYQNDLTNISQKHQKQPLYSMIPQSINKHSINKNLFNMKEDNIQIRVQMDDQSNNGNIKHGTPFQIPNSTTILYQNDSNIKYMQCEESYILSAAATFDRNQQQQQSSLNLTPHKNMPVPISPTQKPTFINFNKARNNNQNLNKMATNSINKQQQSSVNNQELKQTYIDKIKNNSGQKPSVVYNEFKYYTSGSELLSQQNPKKYVSVTNSGVVTQRKSDASQIHIQQQSLNVELSPKDTYSNRYYDLSSPKQNSNTKGLRGSSIRQQILSQGGILSHENSNQKFNIQSQKSEILKQQQYQQQSQYQQQTETKIRELQDYIEQLESDLRESQQKNIELKQKIIDKNAIQSFDRTKKHLFDTEDSLILSEKKGKKKQSNQKGYNSIVQQFNSESNINPSSSIVEIQIQSIKDDKVITPKQQENIRYQNIQDESSLRNSVAEEIEQPPYYLQNDEFQGLIASSSSGLDGNQLNIHEEQIDLNDNYSSSANNQQNNTDLECDGCERLKQLVFQAKEAIDDLKLEIDEWRDLCSEKDTELRKLQHKIYNDIVGVDKKIEFNQEIFTKEFDSNKPVNPDIRKIRNFIQHNKKRIRSKSKNYHGSSTDQVLSARKVNVTHSIRKRSALKNVKDLMKEDFEFYEAEDQGVQTSFIIQSTNDCCLTNISTDEMSNKRSAGQNQMNLNSNLYSSRNQESKDSNVSPDRNSRDIEESQEEINQLRAKNQIQELEIQKLKQQVNLLTKNCEQFLGIVNKTKKKMKKQDLIDVEEIKQNYQIVSNIESYSILEKINEWKREEGLIDSNDPNYQQQVSKIPRPVKLLMDIDVNDIDFYNQKKKSIDNVQSSNLQKNVALDFMEMIKQEQENLKKQQETKYKELQKQQQDYLNLLKGM